MHLYLIRHGDNVLRLSNKADGQIDGYIDAGLSDVGQQQVAALADWLPKHIAAIDTLYTSTLPRAQETADLIVPVYTVPARNDDRLREIGCNRGNGHPWPNDDLPGGFHVAKAIDPFAPVSPANGQESWQDFRRRVGSFIEDALVTHSTQSVMVVCHGGVINAVVDHIFNLGPWRRCDVLVAKASITHFEYGGELDREPWLLHYVGRTVE